MCFICWLTIGEDWHFLWWVRRQVLTEPVRLTGLWGQVSHGGRNGFVLGSVAQIIRPWLVLQAPCLFLHLTAAYSHGRLPLEYEHMGLPICIFGLSKWGHFFIYMVLLLKWCESLWITYLWPPETHSWCSHDFGLIAGESLVWMSAKGSHRNRKREGSEEIINHKWVKSILGTLSLFCDLICTTVLGSELSVTSVYLAKRWNALCKWN